MNKYMIKKILFVILFLSLTVLLSGCLSVGPTNNNKANLFDSGVFKTIDKGISWQQKTLIPTTSGKPMTFAGFDVTALVMDPSDRKTLYAGTVDKGLFYTYDGGDNWQVANNQANIG